MKLKKIPMYDLTLHYLNGDERCFVPTSLLHSLISSELIDCDIIIHNRLLVCLPDEVK